MKKINMKNKITEHYKSGFASSPIELELNELEFIIKHDCECSSCSESIFEMWDFPELLIDEDALMCEDCYNEQSRKYCPICEDSYDVKDYEEDHFVITEEFGKEIGKVPGIYEVKSRPFFFANILTGFDGFFDNSIELVAAIRINFFKKIECGENCSEVQSDMICPECVERFTAKNNYLKSEKVPCILLKKYEGDALFAHFTKEELRHLRQSAINKRITCRGIIEKGSR